MRQLPLPHRHHSHTPGAAQCDRGFDAVARVGKTRHAHWLLLTLTLGFGVFFSGLDQTVVVTILPQMMPDLGITVDTFGKTAWVVNSYLLGYTIALPLMGKLADVFGLRRMYLISTGLFLVGTGIVALSPGLGWFTLARALQALGGGALLPITFAILGTTLPPTRRIMALGLVAALDDASSLLGPIYGAALVNHIGWRGLFWLNIPLQLPWLIMTLLLLGTEIRRQADLDWPSALLLVLAIGTVSWGLTAQGSTVGTSAPLHLAIGVLCAAILSLAFWQRQRRAHAPLLTLDGSQRGRVLTGMSLYGLDGAATITALVCIPLMTDVLWGKPTIDGGLNLLKLMLWMPIGGIIGGLLTPRLGFRTVTIGSFSLIALGFSLMRLWPNPPSSALLWGTLSLLGIGIGLNDAAILGHTLHASPSRARATAAAFAQMTQCIGMMTGMALLAWLGLGHFTQQASQLFAQKGFAVSPTEYQRLMLQTFRGIFLVASMLALLAVILAFALNNDRGKHRLWFAEVALSEDVDHTAPVDQSPSDEPER
ncbi:MFS transporter [Thermorudis peleae]|uniref:MFS transporter n=1 Tax=Thermorudis peleae TaxID=1382356 RepID=UPI0005707690|nr:MFS transporter [Thermorudis peleae]